MDAGMVINALRLAFAKGYAIGMKDGMLTAIYLCFLFQVKHLVVDFFVQDRFPWMWQNKHKLFHLGGWAHAASHVLGSFVIFYATSNLTERWFEVARGLCLIELFAHFFIDYVKMNIGAWRKWNPVNSPHFWDLLGGDQFLHQLTYLFMIAVWLV